MIGTNSTVTLEKAYQICKDITTGHYENFPVASRLLPAKVRKHVYPIYAFARLADDLADEHADKEGLLKWRESLHRSTLEAVSNPVFLALGDTIKRCQLPVYLFDNLLSAFLQDLEKKRYKNLAELNAYCQNSANPVGRIILYLHGYRQEQLCAYSDYICTALQLTNFWQDVDLDLAKDRIYIPQNFLQKYHVSENDLSERKITESFRNLMAELTELTTGIFKKGLPLLDHVTGRLRWELRFTVLGGLSILENIRKVNYNVFQERPKLSKFDWIKIAFKSFSKPLVRI